MKDKLFKIFLGFSAIVIVLICGGMFYSLVSGSLSAFEHFGIWNFISGTEWNPNPDNEQYNALPFIVGTLSTSGLALLISIAKSKSNRN